MSNAPGTCSSIMLEQCVEQIHGRTDGTNEELLTPDACSSVSNARRGAGGFDTHPGRPEHDLAAAHAPRTPLHTVIHRVGVHA